MVYKGVLDFVCVWFWFFMFLADVCFFSYFNFLNSTLCYQKITLGAVMVWGNAVTHWRVKG